MKYYFKLFFIFFIYAQYIDRIVLFSQIKHMNYKNSIPESACNLLYSNYYLLFIKKYFQVYWHYSNLIMNIFYIILQ